MARNEADREDLMREATGLVRRIELALPSRPEPVVIGIKRDGNWSVYLGGEPVYQFDAHGRLRRAFADGFLWRTQGTTLARLERTRSDSTTTLERQDLSPAELAVFLASVRDDLRQLVAAADAGQFRVLRQVPESGELFPELVRPIREVLDRGIELAPQIAGKR